ncbi:MAG: penicillin-binding protein, partial [Deltaproteobacteria bacterium]|nr:penicillin-binding protein [Deltaproteobacteria bacterium]
MLKNVVQSGTGRAAAKLGRHVAGKTGTTSEFRDGWFVGYTPALIAGVWVGYDDHRPVGDRETGARTALPIWLGFMTEAGRESGSEDFLVPEGIDWLEVNLKEAGYPLPVFESSLRARIPIVSGSKIAPPARAKTEADDGDLSSEETDSEQ